VGGGHLETPLIPEGGKGAVGVLRVMIIHCTWWITEFLL